jgi:hypothetical protein
VVTLAISAAACGSGGGSDAVVSIKTLQAAVSNTQDAALSSRFTMDLGISAAGHDLTMHGTGVTSGDGKTLQVTMDIPSLGSFEERLVDGTIYIDFGDIGAVAGRLPEGKRWVRVSLDSLGAQTGTDFGRLLDQAQGNSPTQGLEYLRGLSGDVQNLGDDTVAGEHATHYRASIDYAKVVGEMGDVPAATKEQLSKLGVVPADVWINDQDRVVKMHFAIDAAGLGAGGGRADFTMEITDFGVPVDVQAPPVDETFDFSSLGAQQA